MHVGTFEVVNPEDVYFSNWCLSWNSVNRLVCIELTFGMSHSSMSLWMSHPCMPPDQGRRDNVTIFTSPFPCLEAQVLGVLKRTAILKRFKK